MVEPRKIVRFASTDLNGMLSTERALRKIKGISFMFARMVCEQAGVDRNKQLGLLSDEEIKKLESHIISQAQTVTIPKWAINRRKDPITGNDIHLIGDSLIFRIREDINIEKRIRSRRGIRHGLGLTVRGQKTRSTGRKSKSVGVSRKSAAPAAAAKPAAAASPAASAKPAAAKPATGKPAAAAPAEKKK